MGGQTGKQARSIAASDRMKEVLYDKQLEMENIFPTVRHLPGNSISEPAADIYPAVCGYKSSYLHSGRAATTMTIKKVHPVGNDSVAKRFLDSLASKSAPPAPLSDTAAKQPAQNLLHKEH